MLWSQLHSLGRSLRRPDRRAGSEFRVSIFLDIFLWSKYLEIMRFKSSTLQPSSRFLFWAMIAFGLNLTASISYAELLFSDSFDYPPGALDGNGPPPNSPPGQGGWTTLLGDPQVGKIGLRFRGLSSAGTAALEATDLSTGGEVAAADITPISSGIVWIGFFTRQQSQTWRGGYTDLSFNDLAVGPTTPQFGLTFFAAGQYAIDNSAADLHQATTGVTATNATVWLVVKLDFNSGFETLYVNPSRVGEPITAEGTAQLQMEPEFQSSGFDRLILRSGYFISTYAFDELRVGTNFQDIVF